MTKTASDTARRTKRKKFGRTKSAYKGGDATLLGSHISGPTKIKEHD